MTGYRTSRLMSVCLGLLALASVAAADGGERDAGAEQPAARAGEGGVNQRTHKLRDATKERKQTPKKTTPKTDFGTVAKPGLDKASTGTDTGDTRSE